MMESEVERIYELVSPLVPENKRKELKRLLKKELSEELPDVYTPEMIVNAIGRILEKVVAKKSRDAGLQELSNEIAWVVKGIYLLVIAPKIREIIVASQIRRVSHGDE